MSTPIQSQRIKDILTEYGPGLFIMIIGLIFMVFNNKHDTKTIINNYNINTGLEISGETKNNNTSGVVVEIFTGEDIITHTGNTMPPKDIRLYMDYVIYNGVEGQDYIIAEPSDQPNINSKVGKENTDKIHYYLYKNRNKFTLPSTEKKGYIMFVTTNEIGKNRDLFIGIDGVTIGRIDKKDIIKSYNNNEYLYELSSLKLIGNNGYKFTKDLSKKSNIYINGVVGEQGNYLEQIIIFFK